MARGSGYSENTRQDVLATEREARRHQDRLKRPGTAKAGWRSEVTGELQVAGLTGPEEESRREQYPGHAP